MLFAVKQLAAVEVDPRRSNQHEFNADALRTRLGFSKDRVKDAPLRVLFYLSDDEEPVTEDATFTLYDAREAHPKRSEWRLYYRSEAISELAREGDLFVVFRPDLERPDLFALVVRTGTRAQRTIEEALALDAGGVLKKFVFREQAEVDRARAESLVQLSLLAAPEDAPRIVDTHPLLQNALDQGQLPPTKVLAEAAQLNVGLHFGVLGADDFIKETLDEESRLFFSIEKVLGEQRFNSLIRDGKVPLEEALTVTMSILQSRKSRRGHSLQHHFAALLDREEIPYSAQCQTERGETPDFVIPGARQYADPAFPDARLRLVACKTRVRERWRQILNEAARIDEKYLLTVDHDLSREALTQMHGAKLRPFMPKAIRDDSYPAELRPQIRTVAELVTALRAA